MKYTEPFDELARLVVTCLLTAATILCLGVALVVVITLQPGEDIKTALFWLAVSVVIFATDLYWMRITEPVPYKRAGVEPTRPWQQEEKD